MCRLAKKLELVVKSCKECPYCITRYGGILCTKTGLVHDYSFNYGAMIFENCPLPDAED